MPVYMIKATERIYEVAYVRADSEEEAEKIATEDWLIEWETVDGEFFEIEDVEEVPEGEVAGIRTKISTLEEYNGGVASLNNLLSSSGCPIELPLTEE